VRTYPLPVSNPPRIRVAIVDDHVVVRAAYSLLVETAGDMDVVGEAGTAAGALVLIKANECDVLLLDVSLPDATVLETISAVLFARPDIAVLIVSMHPEEQYAVRLIRAGAAGYFPKDASSVELLAAIRRVASGQKYISETLMSGLAHSDTGADLLPAHEQLSGRERQVFIKLALGHPVTEIADEIGCSIDMVDIYRARIMEQMRFATNADITTYAICHQLLGYSRPNESQS
jgi:two-component system invasion response regulator UvrY